MYVDPRPAMNLLLLGPPGSGKGTQASRLAREFGGVHISTGEILRESVQKKSALGNQAEKILNSGGLVPDQLVLAIMEERLNRTDCEKGFVLDGFPRTVFQAKSLDQWLNEKKKTLLKILIDCSEAVCIERLSQRRTCSKCGCTYHLGFHPPKKENICDQCGASLVSRLDDQLETIKKRLQVYRDLTEPLIHYYEKSSELIRVDGSSTPELVFKNLINLLQCKA